MTPLMTRTNRPSVRIMSGHDRSLSKGLIMAFTNPRITAMTAKSVQLFLAAWMPGTHRAARNSDRATTTQRKSSLTLSSMNRRSGYTTLNAGVSQGADRGSSLPALKKLKWREFKSHPIIDMFGYFRGAPIRMLEAKCRISGVALSFCFFGLLVNHPVTSMPVRCRRCAIWLTA